jgi:hypothetical protein
MIRKLVSWEPIKQPQDGYSIIIGCMRDLAPLAIANLKMCARTQSNRRQEIILVFDCPVEEIPEAVTRAVAELSTSTRVSLIGYDQRQYRVARRINWGWVYCWLSWCLAFRHASTRAVIIHDLDALPLASGFFEEVYDHWLEAGAHYCGIRLYKGNNIEDEMQLVTTFEMAFDVAYLREHFKPFDLFNKHRIVGNRVVNFDTMLWVQWRSPRRAVRPIHETDLVHPSQLISQYVDLASGRADYSGRENGLPILIYFLYLGGEVEPLVAASSRLGEESCRSITFFGRTLYVDGISPQAWAWMEKQIRRIEQHLFGATRPEIASYLQGFIRGAGSHRTVGVECGPYAVPAC